MADEVGSLFILHIHRGLPDWVADHHSPRAKSLYPGISDPWPEM